MAANPSIEDSAEWVLVPREPTEAMLAAGGSAWFSSNQANGTISAGADATYRAMLSASPPSPPAVWSGEDSLSQSQPCGEASADAEVFAGLDAMLTASAKPQAFEKHPRLAQWIEKLANRKIEGFSLASWNAFLSEVNGALDDSGETYLEFKEALDDLRSLRAEHRALNGGGPGWSARWEAAWAKANDLFANEDEAAWCRQQEDAHG